MHRAPNCGTGVVDGNMANASKASAGGCDMRFQHVSDTRAQRQIGVPDNAGTDPSRAIAATVRHRGDAGDEFRLADRPS